MKTKHEIHRYPPNPSKRQKSSDLLYNFFRTRLRRARKKFCRDYFVPSVYHRDQLWPTLFLDMVGNWLFFTIFPVFQKNHNFFAIFRKKPTKMVKTHHSLRVFDNPSKVVVSHQICWFFFKKILKTGGFSQFFFAQLKPPAPPRSC